MHYCCFINTTMERLDFSNYTDVFIIFVHRDSVFDELRELHDYYFKHTLILVMGEQTCNPKHMKRINKLMMDTDSYCLFIRGFHDDTKYFDNEPIVMSNCKTIKDGTIVSVERHNILCIGGFTPLNINYLTHIADLNGLDIASGLNKHDKELINELANSKSDIDVVVTPSTTKLSLDYNDKVKEWLNDNDTLYDALKKDYDYFDALLDVLKPEEKMFYFIGVKHDYGNTFISSHMIEIPYNMEWLLK